MINRDYEGKDKEGMVLRIERSSIHDGDGFRTVVFLKGCPLNCQWCSTPESQKFGIEQAGDIIYGQKMTVEEVMKVVRKDAAFYFHSGGGMTLSGGEVLAQPVFSRTLLKEACTEGINTAVETSFFAEEKIVDSLLPYIMTAYVDLKLMSPDLHQKYCGVENGRILNNMVKTNQSKEKFRLIIRVPLIPGVNDSEMELCKIGKFCAGLKRMEYLQLLPYHRLGSDTYRKLGRPYAFDGLMPPTEEHMAASRKILERYVSHVI
ncbi:MAG: glycyl-radical enzyme activating protein [Eubacteriaceae bacterium]|jgi:pyruvate formate lyase activating enzyme|nr:glycyl-radical enzyme activating protein [Eubacteriaceae bacterium]MDD4508051.1 glycyl-radical enzyme activating protein [Eubacteriaceae bacterium]